MLEFLKETLFDTFLDGISGIIIGLLMWILFLLISGLIIWGTLFTIDYAFRPTQEGTGTVISKEFIPEHTILVYNAALKMNMPQIVEDEWKIWINVDDLNDDVSVTPNFFNTVKEGQQLKVKYSFGRIWKTIYIKDIL